MGKYFGREPRYSQQEAEAQAKQAIDAAVSRGRPPADEWRGLEGRMGEINQELATRPRIDLPPPPARPAPRPARQILAPRPQPETEPAPPAARKRVPVAKPAPVKKAVAKKAPAAAKRQAPAAKRPPAKKRST